MTAPYWTDGTVTLYHGDAREVVPSLGEFDIVMADPPYGIDYQSRHRTVQVPKIAGDAVGEFPMWLFDVQPRVAMFVWCRWDVFRTLPAPASFIVWDKLYRTGGDLDHQYGKQWEGVAFYPGPEHTWAYDHRPADVLRVPRVPYQHRDHPNQKPIAAVMPFIESHPGSVLDPFAGSGTTLVAAKMLGRQAVGVEIDEGYCELAARRLAQDVLPLAGIGAEVPQGSLDLA